MKGKMQHAHRARPVKHQTNDEIISDLISKVIKTLHDREKDQDGLNKLASTEPKYDGTEEELENLDALARLLTGDETCAAICYHITSNKLLVASNKKTPAHAKEYLALLARYISSPFKENYQLLEQKADTQILKAIGELLTQNVFQTGQIQAERYEDEIGLRLYEAISSKNLDAIKKLAISIIQDSGSTSQTRELAIDIIRPLIDTRLIVNACLDGDRLFQKIVSAIKNEQIEYLDNPLRKHAEMRVFDKVFQEKITGTYYLGITKLTCWPCDATLLFFNKKFKGIEFKFSGTHGGTYPGWLASEWVKDSSVSAEFIDFLKAEVGQHIKGKEAAPYTKNFVMGVPILAQFESSEEALEVLSSWKAKMTKQKQDYEQCKKELEEIKKQQKLLQEKELESQGQKPNNQDLVQQSQQLAQITIEYVKKLKELNNIDQSLKELETLRERQNLNGVKEFILNEDENFYKKTVLSKIQAQSTPSKKIEAAITAYQEKYNYKSVKSEVDRLEREMADLKEIVENNNSKKEAIASLKADSTKLSTDHAAKLKHLDDLRKVLATLSKEMSILRKALSPFADIDSIKDEAKQDNQESSTLSDTVPVSCNEQQEEYTDTENFINNYSDLNYQYQDTDIDCIGPLLISEHSSSVSFVKTIGRATIKCAGDTNEQIKFYISERKSDLAEGKRLVGLYQKDGNHWITYVIYNQEEGTVNVLYKDSEGKQSDAFEEDITNALNLIDLKVENIKEIPGCQQHQALEPWDEGVKLLKNCGIFALKNMKTLAQTADLQLLNSESFFLGAFTDLETDTLTSMQENYNQAILAARKEFATLVVHNYNYAQLMELLFDQLVNIKPEVIAELQETELSSFVDNNSQDPMNLSFLNQQNDVDTSTTVTVVIGEQEGDCSSTDAI